MEIYERDGKWFARASGGSWGRIIIPPEEIGPFDERPEPVAQWRKRYVPRIGCGQATFTRFRAARNGEDCWFILEEFLWWAAPGFSGAAWERLIDEQPPGLGDCFVWENGGWERCPPSE
ncbi:MAG: hypothetical protein ACP5ME_14675 [Anaerolineae bacterium]